jgi:hypothetical protein
VKRVSKNLSSRPPRDERTTAMNHKKAMPANGTRARALDTASRRSRSVIQVPDSATDVGVADCSRTRTPVRISPNASPAIAAALGWRTAATTPVPSSMVTSVVA